ncbi:MAG: hypothetical protein ABUK11_04495 [Mariprofundaceae bacterium]
MKPVHIIAITASLFLSSCASMHKPIQVGVKADVKVIDLVRIEYDDMLKIRRLNPFLALMGTSAMVLMDSGIILYQESEYEKRANDVSTISSKQFQEVLVRKLKKNGYKIRLSKLRYWDYFKPANKKLRSTSDGILRIKLDQLGFWSDGLGVPYSASIFVIAELIDPVTRETLYLDRFAVGIHEKSLRLFSAYTGPIHHINRSPHPSYDNFRDLLANPKESREDLLQVVRNAALRIGKGMQNVNSRNYVAYESKDVKLLIP